MAGNGLGEYFGNQAAGAAPALAAPSPTQRPSAPGRAQGEYFAQPVSTGTGEYFAQNGFGAMQVRRPGAVKRLARQVSPFAGALGDATDILDQSKAGMVTGVAAATTLTAIVAMVAIRFGSGWLVGKALAPSAADEKKYAWAGGLGSVFFGTLGLGVEAIVANNARK
jgi:hypothetical protein